MVQEDSKHLEEKTADELRQFLAANIVSPVSEVLEKQTTEIHQKLDGIKSSLDGITVNVSDTKANLASFKGKVDESFNKIELKLHVIPTQKLLWIAITSLVMVIALQIVTLLK